jgi:hypothetical protein
LVEVGATANFEIHEHHSYSLKSCNRDLFGEDLQRASRNVHGNSEHGGILIVTV